MEVRSVEIDSRQAKDGSLFVAFRGERVDGHDYVAGAFQNGAVGALVERVNREFAVLNEAWDGTLPVQIVVGETMGALQCVARYWRDKMDVQVVGITGSVGKTTTKELIYSVLSQKFNSLKTEGNQNNEIGLPLTLFKLRPHHQFAVLEMGMYSLGEIKLLAEIARPNVGVMTLVGTVHVEHVGSQEALARGKRELVEALTADGTAILNYDDPRVLAMADHTPAKIFTYGLNREADLWAENVNPVGIDQVDFDMKYQNETIPVQLPLPGVHSVGTALRAAAVGLIAGLTWNEIVAGLQQEQSRLRMITHRLPNGATLIDDAYNASPNSTTAALDLLNNVSTRKVAILGDMLELGVHEEAGHQEVGERAADVLSDSDQLIAVGRRARTIGHVAIAYGITPDRVHFVDSAAEAVPIVQRVMRPNDTILVKASRGIGLDVVVNALTNDN